MRILILTAAVTMLAAQTCSAQVVMLPTFGTFQYSGSVLVPDGGSAHLGSIGRSAESSRNSGWGSRATGRSISRGTMSAHVQIIDLAEMDRQLLGAEPAEFLRQQKAKEAAKVVPPKPIDPVEAAKQLVRDARRCVQEGHLKAADYYYRRAIGELPSDLAAIARAEYERFKQQTVLVARRDQP
ncbi:hypothetical protein EC9_06750 [Rosistilla ulvae]|uniref:DUF4398 domain-containing protein n=1 Tax=Rosistilla ulvae TaxID=1930277 RepID=A0A517LV67_9BACT|nr:hypothetical protein [Rosistilla ulvae]QDS86511.1 hypothetical protein EC9_06750 [Rosistilla ulvae]